MTDARKQAPAPAGTMPARKNRLSPKKLLQTKWTAVVPVGKEKHFIVTRVIAPEPPGARIDTVELQAVHSGRLSTLGWRELTDAGRWHQGWV